jgi:L-serine dehydratase
MPISTFDLFKIGIGPSSSHTVGPMKAAREFSLGLRASGSLEKCHRIRSELFGSLGATGAGHGSPKAVILGLEGESPETVDVATITDRVTSAREGGVLNLLGEHPVAFDYKLDLVMHRREALPYHSNGMRDIIVEDPTQLPHPFSTAAELLEQCARSGLSISSLMLANEQAWRSEEEVKAGLLELWSVMHASIEKGCHTEGIMPGGLKVKRRAARLYRQLKGELRTGENDPLTVMDWVSLYALAVNEENAAGGRIVTAPTNGAAGIIPAVLRYYLDFCRGAGQDDIHRFLLTAAAIGILYKINASISGAEVGCQGEVGSACSMAAGALADAMGGTPAQVENAAEIAMEHNLGLTCDPIGGLVQVPCIERNAMAAVKAISAARMALRGDGHHFVSLDQVIRTMRDTGRDMQDKYKETARGGLAVNVLEVPVSIIEC